MTILENEIKWSNRVSHQKDVEHLMFKVAAVQNSSELLRI